jgi:hypothetical protein
MKPVPMLSIDKGEEIVHALVSAYIPGTGYYKFLSKQKTDQTFAWVHFVERVNGSKENVYRGEAGSKEVLEKALELMNRNLLRIFGAAAEMKPGKTEVKTTMGTKDDGTVN